VKICIGININFPLFQLQIDRNISSGSSVRRHLLESFNFTPKYSIEIPDEFRSRIKMPSDSSSVTAAFEKLSVPVKLLTAGTAACIADFASFPLDTAKVRLQVNYSLLTASGKIIKCRPSRSSIFTIRSLAARN